MNNTGMSHVALETVRQLGLALYWGLPGDELIEQAVGHSLETAIEEAKGERQKAAAEALLGGFLDGLAEFERGYDANAEADHVHDAD